MKLPPQALLLPLLCIADLNQVQSQGLQALEEILDGAENTGRDGKPPGKGNDPIEIMLAEDISDVGAALGAAVIDTQAWPGFRAVEVEKRGYRGQQVLRWGGVYNRRTPSASRCVRPSTSPGPGIVTMTGSPTW